MSIPFYRPRKLLTLFISILVASLFLFSGVRADANPPPTETATLEIPVTVEEILPE